MAYRTRHKVRTVVSLSFSISYTSRSVEETSVLWCFFKLLWVLIPVDERLAQGIADGVIEVPKDH